MRRVLLAIFCLLLLGCSNSDSSHLILNLGADFNRIGSIGSTEIYLHKDIDTDPTYINARSWTIESYREHYWSFSQGDSGVYTGNPMLEDFGQGQQTVVDYGQMVALPGVTIGTHAVFKLAVTNETVVGYGPYGPGHHYRGISKTSGGATVITVQYDKKKERKGTLDGLYTMLQFHFNEPNFPKSRIDYRTRWAKVFALDEIISERIRKSR